MNVNLGLLLILAFSGLNTLALCLAGWGSNNKYSLLGAARAVAQSVAYEIPLLLAVLAVAFQVGSLDLSAIVAPQTKGLLSWNVFVQPLAFVIFFISAVAETNRAPFDLPRGRKRADRRLPHRILRHGLRHLLPGRIFLHGGGLRRGDRVVSGGWDGPLFPGPWWFLGKVFALVFALMWFRWTFPRCASTSC